MKNVFLLLLIVASVGKLQAQKLKSKHVPASVMTAFKNDYPNTKKTYWARDSSNYQVAFHNGKAPVAVTYDPSGKKVITEMQMPVEDMPQGIIDYIKRNYPNEIVVEAAQIIHGEGMVTYEVQVKSIALVFDANGNFMQSLQCYE